MPCHAMSCHVVPCRAVSTMSQIGYWWASTGGRLQPCNPAQPPPQWRIGGAIEFESEWSLGSRSKPFCLSPSMPNWLINQSTRYTHSTNTTLPKRDKAEGSGTLSEREFLCGWFRLALHALFYIAARFQPFLVEQARSDEMLEASQITPILAYLFLFFLGRWIFHH